MKLNDIIKSLVILLLILAVIWLCVHVADKIVDYKIKHDAIERIYHSNF